MTLAALLAKLRASGQDVAPAADTPQPIADGSEPASVAYAPGNEPGAAPRAPSRGGILHRIVNSGVMGRLLGVDPSLTPEEGTSARSSGLLSAGLRLLQPVQPGESNGFFPALGAAVSAGQQGAQASVTQGDAYAARADARRSQDILRQLNVEPTPEGIQRGIMQLIRLGRPHDAQALVGILNAIRPTADQMPFTGLPDGGGILNRMTGQVTNGGAGASPKAPQQRVAMNPRSGVPEFQEYRDGSWQFTGTRSGNALAPIEASAVFYSHVLDQAEADIIQHAGSPTALDHLLNQASAGGEGHLAALRNFVSGSAQIMESAEPFYIDAYLRMSGLRPSTEERQQAKTALIPVVGDNAETLRAKMRRRQQVREFVRSPAGGTALAQPSSAAAAGGIQEYPQ